MLRLFPRKRVRVSNALAIAAVVALGLSMLAGPLVDRDETEQANGISATDSRQAANTKASTTRPAAARKSGLNISLLLFRRG